MTRPIPTVDLRLPDAEAAAAVDAACREAGFFYVTGHDVAPALTQATFDAMAAFFAAAPDFKERYHIRHSHPHQRGYVPLYEEHLGEDAARDCKESFDLGVDRAPDHPDVVAGKPFAAPNVWPDLDGFRETVEAYHAAMIALGDRLVRLTAIGLGLDADYFDEAMSDPVANLRLLHYPARSRPDDMTGCGAHTDYGFLTVLAQDDVGGLEIEGDGGAWIYIPPVEGGFVVNLGDLLTRWTAGLYRARRHRVTGMSDRARYSIPYFLDPNVDAMIETVPTCRHLPGADAEPVSAGAFLQSRFDDTFSYREKAPAPLASEGPEPYVAPQ
ncbi:MAG: isopenicillin N synthase family oxygenase [Rhodospirillales bacterium]|nr:isopenicillin N synthase family oxygenase [Rhodospirillales bacterium]MBO6786098.1 isopenicillin N synthase family oxygenase [Rhodospirillales bacterium]